MEHCGKVWITGAGPGDEGLLTVKAKAVLECADAVVYDALVSPEIMSMIPSHAEKINVGKRSSRHLVPQEEINQILLKLSKEGKQVVRLKGGDPFVFGRGGEELELLAKEGVPYEVIPGITSALSALAYAGIPVTHRDFTSSFHVITGHPKQNGPSRIDYEALVKTKGTLIFLMGVSSMGEICQNLISAGLDPATPAAAVESGTTARQKQVTATAATLAGRAEEARIKTPAVFAVGEVCCLAEKFAWTKNRILDGRRVVVTRPRRRMGRIVRILREYGAQVIEYPVIGLKPSKEQVVFTDAVERIRSSKKKEEWIVFTSPSGAELFFERLIESGMDVRSLFTGKAQIKIAAIGASTETRLREHGILPDLVPEVYTAEELGAALKTSADAESHVTAFRARKGSPLLFPPLLEKGIPCDDIPLYDTECLYDPEADARIKELLFQGGIDCVTFTSGSTVEAFTERMEGIDFTKIRAVCIGKMTAEKAEKYGMDIVTARQAGEDSLIECILEMW